MSNAIFAIPEPKNEPICQYAPGTPEKKGLKDACAELRGKKFEIPLIIGGQEIKTGNMGKCIIPHKHRHVLAHYHKAGAKEVEMAVAACLTARKTWNGMAWYDRAAIVLKAAELLAGPFRNLLNAATMLAQSKNCYQAEIDAACELIDFFRFNAHYMHQIYQQQPLSLTGTWNRVENRPLEGFVLALTPFNFTSIAGNLVTAPALMGNCVIWKPASTAVYSGYHLTRLFRKAGFPDGVINFLPGSGDELGDILLNSPEFAGLHFTGSTFVFQSMWKTIGQNIANYKTYPRIVGETGGKDFIFAHKSADKKALIAGLIRGAYEYQGQKCSAASRAYIPRSLWKEMKDDFLAQISQLKMGDVENFQNFVNAVIDSSSFTRCKKYIDAAKDSPDAEVIIGGNCNDEMGYFVEPTVILAKKPDYTSMVEEIFGPILTIFVYPDDEYEKYLKICDETTTYGLTGAIFAQEREAITKGSDCLWQTAGNFYINDKPTGAVVGQQPFGGGRVSGTNDKAGSYLNLIRWVSPRTIKEVFVPPKSYKYPFLQEE
ncbi:L-glutamate gamma-semialdehyde dehydrogenase [Candidatus Riflebacteria bacterium]